MYSWMFPEEKEFQNSASISWNWNGERIKPDRHRVDLVPVSRIDCVGD